MGAMNDHRQHVHPASPDDSSFPRPQPRKCTLRSPCYELQLDPISRFLYKDLTVLGQV